MFNRKVAPESIEEKLAALEAALHDKDEQIEKILNSPVVAVALKQAEYAAQKQAELDQMTSKGLNYGIIKDLINSAIHGVEINIRFSTGEVMTIKREDAYNKTVDSFRSETF